MEFKLALLLPLVVAIGWGLNCAVTGQNYATRLINIPTDVTAIGLAIVCMGAITSILMKQPIELGLFINSPSKGWLWLACLSFAICMVLIRLSFMETNATYTVLLECSYALFTPFFIYLFYQQKQLSLQMFVGALFIFAGVFLVMSGQIQKTTAGA
jgi:drug/metabolite transporter (DMT)-like permease